MIIVVAALALPVVLLVALPQTTTAVSMWIAKLIPSLSLPLIVVLTAEATLLLVAAIWWLWWRLPRRQLHRLDVQIHDPKDRADTEDNFRKTVGQALGGAAVLIGAVFAYLQFTDQQRTTQAQLAASRQATQAQQDASQALLISNQVSKGFEQLAGDKLAMRLGGIYALEGVMRTSPEYHQSVLEALCAFVRESSPQDDRRVATDIQAALSVIARRKPGAGNVDLNQAHIPGAELESALLRGAQLEKASLNNANLTGADLSGAKMFAAYLPSAILDGADLQGADLRGAFLLAAYLRGAKLNGANLTATVLQEVLFDGANLTGADLTGSNLMGAYLSRTTLTANLSDTYLKGANLDGASLKGANLDGADLQDADLTNARDLTQEQLDQACGTPKALPPGLTLDKPCPERRPRRRSH